MAGIEHSPPAFFKRGPAPLALLFFYVALSTALIILDTKYHSLNTARELIHIVVLPFQQAAQSPAILWRNARSYWEATQQINEQNATFKTRQLKDSVHNLRLADLEIENQRLRQILGMSIRETSDGVVASILHAARDPFSKKIIVNRGTESDITPGLAVISENGVIGQITRTFPYSAEVTLITDKNQVIPVMIQRTGQRSVVFGQGNGFLELKYIPANADVMPGDLLVTSGIDGVFLGGLPVGRVEQIERETAYAFAQIICSPIVGSESHTEVLILRQRGNIQNNKTGINSKETSSKQGSVEPSR